MVKNYMEDMVNQTVDALLLDDITFSCTCDVCIDNIKAIALNILPPFYITTKTGEVFGTYKNLEFQNKADVISAVLKAKTIVEKSPKH